MNTEDWRWKVYYQPTLGLCCASPSKGKNKMDGGLFGWPYIPFALIFLPFFIFIFFLLIILQRDKKYLHFTVSLNNSESLFFSEGICYVSGDVKITISLHINYPQISLHECYHALFWVNNWEVFLFPSLASLFSWMHFGEIFCFGVSLFVFFIFNFLFPFFFYFFHPCFSFLFTCVISTHYFHIPLPLQKICIFIEFSCCCLVLCWHHVGIAYLFWRVLVIWGNGKGGGYRSMDGWGIWMCWDIEQGDSCYIFNLGIYRRALIFVRFTNTVAWCDASGAWLLICLWPDSALSWSLFAHLFLVRVFFGWERTLKHYRIRVVVGCGGAGCVLGVAVITGSIIRFG